MFHAHVSGWPETSGRVASQSSYMSWVTSVLSMLYPIGRETCVAGVLGEGESALLQPRAKAAVTREKGRSNFMLHRWEQEPRQEEIAYNSGVHRFQLRHSAIRIAVCRN